VTTVDDELRMIVEERAIIRTMHRYAHAMDQGLEAQWLDTFTEDAVFDVVRSDDGTTVHREEGHGELARYIARYPKPPAYRKHVVVDPLIEIRGDEATVESYWLLLERDAEGGAARLSAFGHYRDRLRKIDGEWKIAERLAKVEAS
jgi:3-phenylpropionate/cinnamic acid dioxygenase small subunit